MPDKALKRLAKHHNLNVEQLAELLRLLQDEEDVHYLLRYRKDLSGGFDAEQVEQLVEENRELEDLERERRKILSKLEEQEELSESLRAKIAGAETLCDLIDHYVPFRPRKRSRSRQALAHGLEPLAKAILAQEAPKSLMSEAAAPFVGEDEAVGSLGAVLDGAFHIVCDWMAEEKAHREKQRAVLQEGAVLRARTGRKSIAARLRGEFKEYLSLRTNVKDVHPSQTLALMRGRRLKVLEFGIEAPLIAMCHTAAGLYMAGGAGQFDQIDSQFHDVEAIPAGEALGELSRVEFLYFCIRHSLCEVLAPILVRELQRDLNKKAEDFAVGAVRRTLHRLLMEPPQSGRPVLGIWPGYRTGCKLAAVDADGRVLETTIVFPHTPQLETAAAKEKALELIRKHNLSLAAIADGTAAQETEALLSEVIAEGAPELRYAVVSGEGVSAYCGTQAANDELPGLSPDHQAAVSTARRLLDPLAELTKLGFRSLCNSPYIQDVNGALLKRAVAGVVEHCVAQVGADLNTAPASLLKLLPALDAASAAEVVKWRSEKGPFSSRAQLRDVPKVDEKTWRQAVGFVRVKASANPLEITRIHPDHYQVAMEMLQKMGVEVDALATEEGRAQVAEKRGEVNFGEMEKESELHYLVLKDMLDEMVQPWPDPRVSESGPVLRDRRPSFDDLKADQVLTGVVRKVVDFGAFIDVGVGEDGLVHISELSDRFVRSPYDVICEGDVVQVRVVEIDAEKRRIALTMRSEESRARAAAKRERAAHTRAAHTAQRESDRRPGAPPRRVARPTAAHAPQSTVGKESRRVQKAANIKYRTARVQKPTRPSQDADQAAKGDGEDRASKVDHLLRRLDFAAIEKRGEEKQ